MGKPKIRQCESNGVVAIAAEIDFREWWLYEHPRSVLAGRGEADERRAMPRLTMFFTDNPSRQEALGELITGSMDDHAKLICGCEVEAAYLFIPKFDDPRHGFIPVSLEAAFRLVKGSFVPGKIPRRENVPETAMTASA